MAGIGVVLGWIRRRRRCLCEVSIKIKKIRAWSDRSRLGKSSGEVAYPLLLLLRGGSGLKAP